MARPGVFCDADGYEFGASHRSTQGDMTLRGKFGWKPEQVNPWAALGGSMQFVVF
nr:hypothetical protein [uncultured Ruegeria sp.]